MALPVCTINSSIAVASSSANPNSISPRFSAIRKFEISPCSFINKESHHHRRLETSISVKLSEEDNSHQRIPPDNEVDNIGVRAALSMLKFYKREISPLLPKSCRYVPTCSEYSMIALKKYGLVKGTVLTAWRICRCNPLGGSGFDPPRWFGENDKLDQ